MLAPSSPGVSGALSAVLAALVAAGKIVVAILSIVLNPDAVPFSGHAGVMLAMISYFMTYLRFSVLAGYLGGRFGGRLRRARIR